MISGCACWRLPSPEMGWVAERNSARQGEKLGSRGSPHPRCAWLRFTAITSTLQGEVKRGCCLKLRARSRALVLPVGHQIVDDGRVGERRGVAEITELVLRDLAQDATHDLARTRFRQA